MCMTCFIREARPGLTVCVNCSKRSNRNYHRLKDEVYARYGGYSCTYCGENDKDVLTIDHINDDGNVHRKELNGSAHTIYQWLKDNDYPEGFQVLCRNHNWKKHASGLPEKVYEPFTFIA